MPPQDPIEGREIDSRLRTRRVEPAIRDRPACDICGGPMIERQCKILCPNCGYTRDCSDP